MTLLRWIMHAAMSGMLLAVMSGCVSHRPASTPPVPADLSRIPDAVPRYEPLAKRGNPAFYEALGQRYVVLKSGAGYIERGVASWYGPGFHQAATSNGEVYDMYAMTAAHKTLPLPAYVQVTNLTNGKQVVVRVNDRGPFRPGRIIDLSYTAAAKLDMLRAGTALVEVRVIQPGDAPPPPPLTQHLYVQVGAFGVVDNAQRLVKQLQAEGYNNAFVRNDAVSGHTLYRVRIGPVEDVDAFDRIATALRHIGVMDAMLASE